MKKILITAIAVAFAIPLRAQTTSTTTTSPAASTAVADTASPVDGYFNTAIYEKASPFNYPSVDKNNVRLYKRVWRDIDLSDPQNQSFAMPGSTLIEVILAGIKSGKITAYDPVPTPQNPTGDNFKVKLTYDQVMNKLTDSVLVPKYDQDGKLVSSSIQRNDFNPQNITKFRIKEDIFYDKQRSKTETRIVGIAPMSTLNFNGQNYGTAVNFWIYFPQARNAFVTVDVSDPDRNMVDMTMDDLFIQRRFNAMIVKESNSLGQVIKDFTQNENREREAMLAEQKIQEYKAKIWQYGKAPATTPATKIAAKTEK